MTHDRNLLGCQWFDEASTPRDWNCLPLGARIELEYGAALPEHKRLPGRTPVYGSNGQVGTHNSALVTGPGILVGRKGSIGIVHRCEQDFWPIDTVYFVRRLRGDDWGYLAALLDYLDLGRLNAATGVPGLSRRDALAIRGAFPPEAEQKAIVRILDACNKAIGTTTNAVTEAVALEDCVLRQLLSCGLGTDGRVRDSQANPAAFGPARLRSLPTDWQVSDVQSEFDIATGFTLGEHRRPQLNRRRYLRVANVQRGFIDLSDVSELEAKEREMQKRTLALDDLLIVEGHADPYQIGRCARVPAEAVGLTFQNHLYRLRSRRLDPRFAEIWLNSQQSRRYWQRMCSTSSGLNTINQRKLKVMPVVVPDRREQEQIADIAKAHRDHVKSLESELACLERLERGLMQDLLTGKVRVTNRLSSGPTVTGDAGESDGAAQSCVTQPRLSKAAFAETKR